MIFYTIPVTSQPNQSMRINIPIDGVNKTLILNFSYNEIAKYWTMEIIDDITNKQLVSSIPLITGVYPSANLLEQYSYLNIGSACLIKINPDNNDESANDENLNTDFALVWGDTIE